MTIQPPSPDAPPSRPPAPTLLNLKIRFSHSELPDLSLLFPPPLSFDHNDDEASEETAPAGSVNNLKGRIRASLPEAWHKHGLKLIYGGRVLDGRDDVFLALRLPLPTARHALSTINGTPGDNIYAAATPNDSTNAATHKGKGKAHAPTTPPIYIHCAITPTPLDARTLEHQLALEATPPPPPTTTTTITSTSTIPPHSTTPTQHPPQQPQGFDRLLAPASGFNASDVAALRAQFRSIVAARYTPDTMPSGSALLRMEEAWLDDSSSLAPPPPVRASASAAASMSASAPGARRRGSGEAGAAAEGGGEEVAEGATGGGYTDDDASAALDDTFYGVFMGFFWPLGACVWGLREEGVWSRRRGWAVLAGVMVNVGFGVVRVLS